jgi:hypothetical protein
MAGAILGVHCRDGSLLCAHHRVSRRDVLRPIDSCQRSTPERESRVAPHGHCAVEISAPQEHLPPGRLADCERFVEANHYTLVYLLHARKYFNIANIQQITEREKKKKERKKERRREKKEKNRANWTVRHLLGS